MLRGTTVCFDLSHRMNPTTRSDWELEAAAPADKDGTSIHLSVALTFRRTFHSPQHARLLASVSSPYPTRGNGSKNPLTETHDYKYRRDIRIIVTSD